MMMELNTHSEEDVIGINNIVPIGACDYILRNRLSSLFGYYHRQHSGRMTLFGKHILVLVFVATVSLAHASTTDVSTHSNVAEHALDEQSIAKSVLASMNRRADPCENFYEYACGSWLNTTSIPSDRARYFRSFSSVFDRIQLQVRDILERDLQDSDDPAQSKAGFFYASCIDQMGIGALDTSYLSLFKQDFKSLMDARTFSNLMTRLQILNIGGPFKINVGIDVKNPGNYSLYLSQGGLGLPHRDNYFSTKDSDVNLRRMYVKLIENLLVTAGEAGLIPTQGQDGLADKVLDFETTLANVTLLREELRDPEKSYNKISIRDLSPSFHVLDNFRILRTDERRINSSIVLDNVPFFDELGLILERLDRERDLRRVVRAYLAFHLVSFSAERGLLGEDLLRRVFSFEQLLFGTEELPARWKVCQSITNTFFGEAVGAAFVKKYFSDDQKAFAQTLSLEIANVFGNTLKTGDWMDSSTRAAALEKLAAVVWKVGYSENLDTYDDVVVSKDSYYSTIASAQTYLWKREVEKLGKPVDKTEWFLLPHRANAYYSSALNEMVFPAGILQQPFFSDKYPDAMNYGSIGIIVGHELLHGFDDQGRKYDKDGRLVSWWSSTSAARFEDKAKCYVSLYDMYKPDGLDINVRGNLTLGENLADANGVDVAYEAFKQKAENKKDGIAPPNAFLARELTNDQLFFVAYAQLWCSLYRPEALEIQVMGGVHSPPEFRVEGPLSQSTSFAKVFSCRKNSRYNPEEKCDLW